MYLVVFQNISGHTDPSFGERSNNNRLPPFFTKGATNAEDPGSNPTRGRFYKIVFLNIFKHLFFSSTHNDNAY
jgi:hypothetical protein